MLMPKGNLFTMHLQSNQSYWYRSAYVKPLFAMLSCNHVRPQAASTRFRVSLMHAEYSDFLSRAAVFYLSGASTADASGAAADASAKGAEDTKAMEPQVGRSSYVPREVTRTVADPGAIVVSIWMRAIAEALASK